MDNDGISVILPAHQEEAGIGACLRGLCTQRLVPGVSHQIVVIANGCTDATAQLARDAAPALTTAGWQVLVLETAIGNKIAALNMGDAAATGGMRIYLDADVVIGPGMIEALHTAPPSSASSAVPATPGSSCHRPSTANGSSSPAAVSGTAITSSASTRPARSWTPRTPVRTCRCRAVLS